MKESEFHAPELELAALLAREAEPEGEAPEAEEPEVGYYAEYPFKPAEERKASEKELKRLEKEEKELRKRVQKREELRRQTTSAEEEARLEELKAAKRRFARASKPTFKEKARGTREGFEELGKWAKMGTDVATLGGTKPKFVRKELYTTPGLKELTSPGGYAGMRELTTIGGGGKLRELVTPKVTTPGLGAPRLTSRLAPPKVSPAGMESHLAMLRTLSVPKGLSGPEKIALSEIARTQGPDLKADVVEKLVALGIPRPEAVKAVESLLRKGVLTREGKGLEVKV